MFGIKTNILDKLMLKSLGYAIIKYINKFLGIIGIDLHFFTYKAIIATVVLCSLILIVKFTSIISNLLRKNDFRTEKSAKTIRTIRTEKTNLVKKSTTSSSSSTSIKPVTAKRVIKSSRSSSTSSGTNRSSNSNASSKTKVLSWTSSTGKSKPNKKN